MATLDLTKVLWVTGRLSYGVTAPATNTTYPHSGTALGRVSSVRFNPGYVTTTVTAEEFGGEVVEHVQGGQNPVLLADLDQWFDADNAGFWPNNSTTKILHPSSSRAGAKLSSGAVNVMFTPDDTSAHPCLLLYKAIPVLRPEAYVPFSVLNQMKHPIMFRSLRDASTGLSYELGLLSGLTNP